MCNWVKSGANRIDPCIREEIKRLSKALGSDVIIACCCGHGRYNKTIVIKTAFGYMDLITSKGIPRIRKFYKRDKFGYYFIPEVNEEKTSIPPTHKEAA